MRLRIERVMVLRLVGKRVAVYLGQQPCKGKHLQQDMQEARYVISRFYEVEKLLSPNIQTVTEAWHLAKV